MSAAGLADCPSLLQSTRTMTLNPLLSCRAIGLVLCLTGVPLTGCGGGGRSLGVMSAGGQTGPIVIDGFRHDWTDRSVPTADEHFLYLPIRVEGSSAPLQAMDETLVLMLDLDADPTTGDRATRPRVAATLGAELLIEFSPPSEGGPRRGVRVQALDASGSWMNISHADIGLVALPTHASDWFELRISRRLSGVDRAPEKGMRTIGRTSGMWLLYDGSGTLAGWSDPFMVDLPRASPSARRVDAHLPARQPGTIRIVTFNVHGRLGTHPEPFARLLDALDADILLLQEWNGGSALDLETWLTANIAGGESWHTVVGESPDVAIAARGSVRPFGPGRLELADSSRPIRFVGAVVTTPLGEIAVASVHLKCCGSATGPEESRRLAEAEAINRALGLALGREQLRTCVIGGDLNLVGSRTPIETLRSGLDADGTHLEIIHAGMLGDGTTITWSADSSPFLPSRLDYMLVGEAGARVVRSFVFDTRVLSEASLARIGLDRTDSAVSDHLPVVVDLVPRRR